MAEKAEAEAKRREEQEAKRKEKRENTKKPLQLLNDAWFDLGAGGWLPAPVARAALLATPAGHRADPPPTEGDGLHDDDQARGGSS